jgi:hypothetical protein
MDHKGPEHHYDELEFPENGRTVFFQQGEIQPETVQSEGGDRPYRGRPSPVEEEMRERNTFEDGEDQGGNPTQTGLNSPVSKNVIEEAEEQADQITDPTNPEGLGELDPMKDNTWKPGDRPDDPHQNRDEILGSVRRFSDDDSWDEIVEDFEDLEGNKTDDPVHLKEDDKKITAASWLENDGQDSNVPVEHLGWDIVDVVEPSKEFTEAANKYSMPLPKGITDNLHEALIKTNAWTENPEENGKLRPYKEYWSVIRPKFKEGSIQIGVEDPHMADIINHVARTDDLSVLDGMEQM